MQISYEMVSNAHVRQLTVRVPLILDSELKELRQGFFILKR